MEAEVDASLGGMVAALRVDGRDALSRDEGKVSASYCRSGGIPALFPFAGKSGDDSYRIEGRRYSMPKHGFAWNRPFAVKERTESSVTLSASEDEELLRLFYPFRHTLELSYLMARDVLELAARVENRSRRPMPHAMGWHPYFRASNKALLEFRHGMKYRYDYAEGKEYEAPSSIRLDRDWDDVFQGPRISDFFLESPADGYALHCTMDDAFRSIVVYTGCAGSVCIEPWCGVPDSVNNGRQIRWIPPKQSEEYKVQLHLKAI
jgi:galactose mutarotase-like enzyme